MSVALRILLIVFSLATMVFCVRRIRASSMLIDDAMFWFLLTGTITLLALFPQIGVGLSAMLGVESPANLVFLVMIFLLMVKVFSQSLRLARLQTKLERLSQEIALQRLEAANGESKKECEESPE